MYIRMYAILGQVVTYTSSELEELFYYCNILAPRLTKPGGDDGSLDLGSAAVLTHFRAQEGTVQNVSLQAGDGTGVPGLGSTGHGAQHLPDKVHLSELIQMLNTKSGFDFTEVDALMWAQQFEAAAQDTELRKRAVENT